MLKVKVNHCGGNHPPTRFLLSGGRLCQVFANAPFWRGLVRPVSRNCCLSRSAWCASCAAALLWLFAATAASGQTNPGATYDPAAVVQAICRQYAAAQTGMPVDTVYAQCMYARGYRLPGFSPSPDSPGYQGELPGPAAHNGGA